MKVATFEGDSTQQNQEVIVVMTVCEARHLHAALNLLRSLPRTDRHNRAVIKAAYKAEKDLESAPIW